MMVGHINEIVAVESGNYVYISILQIETQLVKCRPFEEKVALKQHLSAISEKFKQWYKFEKKNRVNYNIYKIITFLHFMHFEQNYSKDAKQIVHRKLTKHAIEREKYTTYKKMILYPITSGELIDLILLMF